MKSVCLRWSFNEQLKWNLPQIRKILISSHFLNTHYIYIGFCSITSFVFRSFTFSVMKSIWFLTMFSVVSAGDFLLSSSLWKSSLQRNLISLFLLLLLMSKPNPPVHSSAHTFLLVSKLYWDLCKISQLSYHICLQ